jgi:hypothetical protein
MRNLFNVGLFFGPDIIRFVMRRKIICQSLCAWLAFGAVATIHAQGTAFMYQGWLNDGGSPATGNYDLQFAIYDAVTNGNAISVPLTNSATAVSNGLFTATLDFGPVFTGTNYWLQIGVRTNGSTSAFTMLVPRQPILPVPYAIFANAASNLLGTLATTQLSGTLPSSAFAGYTNTVSLTNSANFFSGTFNGTFAGNGINLMNLNASQLTGGTVADARLSSNVPLLNANQTFSAANNFTNIGNSFSGSFFGNGLVGWITTNGTAVQAMIDHGYLLTNSQLVTVTLPVSPNAGDIVRISGAGAGGWKIAQNMNQSVLGNFSSFASSDWTLTSVSASQNWDSIAMSADASKLIASTLGGGVYSSLNSGLTWVQTNSTAGTWRSVACSSDGSKIYAARFGGGIYTNSPTTSWGLNASTAGLNWFAIACSTDGTKLIAAISNNASGGVYTSGDSGGTWGSTGAAAGNWISVASSADGSKLVAAIFGGGIYTSANWSTATSAGNQNWVSVASSADGSKLAAAVAGGFILTSGNSGSTWVTNNVPATNWQSIASSADGSKLAATVLGGGIYLSSNFGLTWVQAGAPSNNWYAIASSSDGSKLAATIYGGGIYTAQTALQSASTTGTNGYISGPQGSAVELQYIGNGQFMPVSSAGTIWAQ